MLTNSGLIAGPHYRGIQFHAESILTEHGYELIHDLEPFVKQAHAKQAAFIVAVPAKALTSIMRVDLGRWKLVISRSATWN